MEKNEYYGGPHCPIANEEWLPKPSISCSSKSREERALKAIVPYSKERDIGECDELLIPKPYWKVQKTTAGPSGS